MKNSKLLKRLKLLTKEEMKSFLLFVRSPYFNSNKSAAHLLEHLRYCYKDSPHPVPRKKTVYHKLYPDKSEYKEKRVNDLMTCLFKLFNDFLRQNQFDRDSTTQKRQQTTAYQEKCLSKEFFDTLREREAHSRSILCKEDFHFELYCIHKVGYLHPETEKNEPYKSGLEKASHHLDVFYLREKLYHILLLKNRECLTTEQHDYTMLRIFRKEHSDIIKNCLILHFTDCIISLLDNINDEIILKNLRDKISEVLPLVDFEKGQSFLVILLNVYLRNYRKGNHDLLTEIFELYKEGLKYEFFLTNGCIYEVFFVNICYNAARLRKEDWLDSFISEYKNKIFPSERTEDVLNLALAITVYEKSLYTNQPAYISKAISLIDKMSFSKISYSHRVNSVLLKMYFDHYIKDLRSLDFIINFCNNYERQLTKNNSDNNEKIILYIRFSQYVKQLVKLIKKDNSTSEINAFSEELQNGKTATAGRAWLIKKAEDAIAAPPARHINHPKYRG